MEERSPEGGAEGRHAGGLYPGPGTGDATTGDAGPLPSRCLHHVTLSLERPGPGVAVSRRPPRYAESERLLNAIGKAFDEARRDPIERREIRRGKVEGARRSPATP